MVPLITPGLAEAPIATPTGFLNIEELVTGGGPLPTDETKTMFFGTCASVFAEENTSVRAAAKSCRTNRYLITPPRYGQFSLTWLGKKNGAS
jgi:hypothetical protein